MRWGKLAYAVVQIRHTNSRKAHFVDIFIVAAPRQAGKRKATTDY
jgi:hypothetical protein